MRSCAAVCGAGSWVDRRDNTAVHRRLCRVATPRDESVASSRFAIYSQMSDQFIDKGALTRQHLSPSLRHAEIGNAVDFGKVLCPSRSRRPLHLEKIAGKPVQIEISFHREGVDHFPALLTQWRERRERSCGRKTGFLVELAFRASEQVAGFDITLRD